MKKCMSIGMLAACVFAMGACLSSRAVDAAHNARNSLNWEGVYTGLIPAADGPGINVRLTLYADETYEISYHYIDKGDGDFTENGSFIWDAAGSVIILDAADLPPYYRVGENRLTQLDMKRKQVTGALAEYYVLRKEP
jgi:uncharacterized lipoprotein NlpE involved in copper resistance